MLSRTVRHLEGRLLVTYEVLEDKLALGAGNRDSDTLYQLLQATEGCEVVLFVREEDAQSCTVGLRSNGGVDVGAIAKSFGGGGHRQAAGFRWEGDRVAITEKLIDFFAQSL